MTIKEFIKEQIVTRAAAAQELGDDLTINGISIFGGCTASGIHISTGIDELAEIAEEKVFCKLGTISEKSGLQLNEYYFKYNGTRFYELRAERPSKMVVDNF